MEIRRFSVLPIVTLAEPRQVDRLAAIDDSGLVRVNALAAIGADGEWEILGGHEVKLLRLADGVRRSLPNPLPIGVTADLT
jgi:hypothetical protein